MIRKGIIKKICSTKTILVLVEQKKQNLNYKKFFVFKKHFLVHYENVFVKEGDFILIKSYKPISKRKRWIYFKKNDSNGNCS